MEMCDLFGEKHLIQRFIQQARIQRVNSSLLFQLGMSQHESINLNAFFSRKCLFCVSIESMRRPRNVRAQVSVFKTMAAQQLIIYREYLV